MITVIMVSQLMRKARTQKRGFVRILVMVGTSRRVGWGLED
jgi:hypothetical protein